MSEASNYVFGNEIERLAKTFKLSSNSERVSVWAKSGCGRFLFPLFAEGVTSEIREKMVVDLTLPNGGLAHGSATFGEWFVLNKNDAEVRANSAFEKLTGYSVIRSISIPIYGTNNTPIGVLQGLNPPSPFKYCDVLLAEDCASLLSSFVEAAEARNSLNELKSKAETLIELWDLEQKESGIKELDTFVLGASGVMSTLWNLSKSLELLEFYEDTVEARMQYKMEVFDEKITGIEKCLRNMEKKIAALRDIHDEDGKIRIFIHQINPTLFSVSTTAEMLKRYFERESTSERRYDNERYLSLIKEMVVGLNMFHRLTKQYIYLDNTITRSEITTDEMHQWLLSYSSWFENFTYNGETKEISFDVKFESNGYEKIHIDTLRVKECIDTLLTNAAEELLLSGIENPKVTLESSIMDDKLYITVADNGRGVPEEYKERIFEKYFTKNKPSGTGIGLGVVRLIMKAMGGSIHVENNNGAVFHIALPAGKDETQKA